MIREATTIQMPTDIFRDFFPEEKRVLDILDGRDQENAIQELVEGKILLIECGGPIGLMAVSERSPDKTGLVKGEEKLRHICALKGKALEKSPFIQYVPPEGLDKVIDYGTMAEMAGIEEQRYRYALRKAMVRSGAIFQIVPKKGIIDALPFSCLEISKEGKTYPTLGVSCPNEFYPALGRIISGAWREDKMIHITSANYHGQSTLTEMDEAIKLFDREDIVCVDNPKLRTKMKELEIEPSSYTLALTINSGRKIPMERQGKDSPEWIVKLLNEGLGEELYTLGEIGTKLLTEPPYREETVDFLFYREMASQLGRAYLALRT